MRTSADCVRRRLAGRHAQSGPKDARQAVALVQWGRPAFARHSSHQPLRSRQHPRQLPQQHGIDALVDDDSPAFEGWAPPARGVAARWGHWTTRLGFGEPAEQDDVSAHTGTRDAPNHRVQTEMRWDHAWWDICGGNTSRTTQYMRVDQSSVRCANRHNARSLYGMASMRFGMTHKQPHARDTTRHLLHDGTS